MPQNADLEYCRRKFADRDYYHYLISLFMPADKQPGLWTLGAFKDAIESIPSSVSEPTLGLMRLTWWRDQIELIREGKVTQGQPVLSALNQYCRTENEYLVSFINEHEVLVENSEIDFISKIYTKLIEKILGQDYPKYFKLENKLTALLRSHHGSRWEGNPPFLALRLWWAAKLP